MASYERGTDARLHSRTSSAPQFFSTFDTVHFREEADNGAGRIRRNGCISFSLATVLTGLSGANWTTNETVPATMKINPKHANLIFAVAMSAIMSFIMTFAITAINTGFNASYPLRWFQAWLLAWPLAFASNFTIGPRMRQWVMSRTTDDRAPRP